MLTRRVTGIAMLGLGLACTGLSTAMAACPANNSVCGNVMTFENSPPLPLPLPGVVMELRDRNGKVITTFLTNGSASGNYQFTPPTIPGSYFVDPIVDSGQFASPLHIPIQVDGAGNVTPSPANFTIGGTSVTITVQGETPGTFVLITPFPFTNVTPPVIDQTGSFVVSAYSRTVGNDGKALISVAPGFNYYISCWKPTGAGTALTYTDHHNPTAILGGSGAGGIFQPLDALQPIGCPQ